MAQGVGGKSLGSMAAIALAVCAMAALAVCLVSAGAIDTGSGPKPVTQLCPDHQSYIRIALNSNFLACHICCSKKNKSAKYLIKGSEVIDDKCQCVVQGIRED